MTAHVAEIIVPAILTFVVGIFGAPALTKVLYEQGMWKKKSVARATDGGTSSVTQKIHNDEERKTPRMGGIVVWGSVAFVALIILILGVLTNNTALLSLSFISRSQTWLPLVALMAGGLVGMIDDYLVCKGGGGYVGGGLSLRLRLLFVTLVAVIGAWWFYIKLGTDSILVPGFGVVHLGVWFIALFVAVILGLYSGGIIDGVDGLAGGIFSVMFASYGIIALSEMQFDLAAFCLAVVGGLLAFLWYNIPPARFFLSETGTMGLTITLGIVAFLSGHVLELALIALPLIVTTLSSVIQLLSKKFRNGKRVFLVAPLHNHFQAKGWPPHKVTMRYWVVSIVAGFAGVILALFG
jgi:phospho-N-acetylmuramoyl-pentapeptide-transferase